eukprot:TRINITY_DN2875_c0_g1_i1.p1 TRINITY_DN2875_c0_g1~~TRINITY_DN2875_c0_g1_i1.p1  ORF type:complete len:486 (-),score=129.18 TRINITY_DN2875_c0_g1_i1:298-1755(-)
MGVKKIIAAACVGVAASSNPSLEDSREILVGLTKGFIEQDVKDMQECMKNTKQTVQDVDAVVSDCKKKDARDVLRCLAKLADAIKTFPVALKECKAADSDIKSVEKALQTMSSPQQFAYHVGKNLILDHVEIFHEISTGITDYDEKKYEGFGENVGEALHKLILSPEGRFKEFAAAYNKNYAPAEMKYRQSIFAKNLELIYRIQEVEGGTAKYTHLSPYADISPDEFSKRHGLLPGGMQKLLNAEVADQLKTDSLPTDLDWVAKGAVNPVKNQGQCGSCWAFSTVANIEGAGFVTTGKLMSLSEQELVDCDKNGDHGCQGGLPSNAFQDMIKNKLGLELESAYPYKGRDDSCSAKSPSEVAFITGFKTIAPDEDQMAAATVKYGPLSIGINAGPMQWYGGGIAHPFKFLCNPKAIDHGVAIVGFGKEGDKAYWKIRNSWGAGWGEKGYYRIVRGFNACGLTSMVTTATGVSFKSSEEQSSDSLVV